MGFFAVRYGGPAPRSTLARATNVFRGTWQSLPTPQPLGFSQPCRSCRRWRAAHFEDFGLFSALFEFVEMDVLGCPGVNFGPRDPVNGLKWMGACPPDAFKARFRIGSLLKKRVLTLDDSETTADAQNFITSSFGLALGCQRVKQIRTYLC